MTTVNDGNDYFRLNIVNSGTFIIMPKTGPKKVITTRNAATATDITPNNTATQLLLNAQEYHRMKFVQTMLFTVNNSSVFA